MHFTIVIHTKPFKDIFILHQAHKVWLFKFNGWSFSYRIKVKRILFGGSKLCILILWVWFIDCTQIQNTAGRNLNKDLTCKNFVCLLACTFETTLVRSSSSLFPTEEEHNNQHYHSQQHLFYSFKTQCL